MHPRSGLGKASPPARAAARQTPGRHRIFPKTKRTVRFPRPMPEERIHATVVALARSRAPIPSDRRCARVSAQRCAPAPTVEIERMFQMFRVSLCHPDMREWQECAAIIRAPDQPQTTMKKVPFKYHLALLALCGGSLAGQDAGTADNTTNNDPPERWNLYYQATSIGQRHGAFNSPYEGPFSFQP